MIIFDLEGTLADCEHRRHFVDPEKARSKGFLPAMSVLEDPISGKKRGGFFHKDTKEPWKPDWKSFFEACDNDTPIEPVIEMWNQQISLGRMDVNQIWSGRCESVRQKTELWLENNLLCFEPHQLKIRAIGNTMPDHELKERLYNIHNLENPNQKIEFVFDSDPNSIAMWRRRGIFVFDVNQCTGEF